MRGLEREAALPVPRMGLGFVVGVVISLVVVASAADGLLWKYSEEREEVRARAALAEGEVEQLQRELRSLRRENAELRALHQQALLPEPIGLPDERGGMPPCRQ